MCFKKIVHMGKKGTSKRWYGADHPMWPLRKAPKLRVYVVLYIGPNHLILFEVKLASRKPPWYQVQIFDVKQIF